MTHARLRLWRVRELEVWDVDGRSVSTRPGLSPIAMMLQAWITFTPSVFARASTASSSAPGFSQTSGMPFRAMSSITFTPMWPGT